MKVRAVINQTKFSVNCNAMQKEKKTTNQQSVLLLITPCSQRHYKDKSKQVFGSKKPMKIKNKRPSI